MTNYLSIEQDIDLIELATGAPPQIREPSLLDSAVHRPQASMFGQEAHSDLFGKAAALFQALAINHPLVDGNKRTAWVSVDVFLRRNGVTLDTDDDTAYDFVIAVAAGDLSDLGEIADRLRSFAGSPG